MALLDVDGAGVRRAAAELEAIGLEADVADEAAMTAAFAELDARLGRLDAAVACAGVGLEGALDEVAPEVFDRAVAINLRGVYLTLRLAIPRLRAAGGGGLVVLSSNAGLVARPFDPIYGMTKAGQVQLVRSLALSLARDHIRVNAVCPGPVDTPTLWRDVAPGTEAAAVEDFLASVPLGRALGRVASADEVAAAIAWLLSEGASYVTGAALPVDGGKTAGLQVGVA
jgi:NAD(P)-dependent dehydrogenase (short-subunit alcohol dehydrogenase family)